MKETKQALGKRIKSANDRADLMALDARITRHYNAGTITAGDLMALDARIMARLAKLESNQ